MGRARKATGLRLDALAHWLLKFRIIAIPARWMANSSLAIFTHPRCTPDFHFQQMPMDPPIAPEVVSARTGIPLISAVQPGAANNRYHREMVDQIHRNAPFRTGYEDDTPITAFSPSRTSKAYQLAFRSTIWQMAEVRPTLTCLQISK